MVDYSIQLHICGHCGHHETCHYKEYAFNRRAGKYGCKYCDCNKYIG